MRKIIISLTFLVAIFNFTIFQSCLNRNDSNKRNENKSSNLKGSLVSEIGGTKSHEFGSNCASCHTYNGKAKTIFTVSGSLLDEARSKVQNKGIIKLFTRPNGEGDLVGTLYTDSLGNFYTTENIDVNSGVYPTLLGTPGVAEDTKHMPKPIFNGDCNNCHGPTTEKLGID